jgi:hypothetical protein
LMSRAAFPPAKLQSLCQSWEPAFSDIAAACYEQVIKASYKDNGGLAEQSFLAWITLRSDNEQLTEESLKVLPEQWNTGAVDNVRAFLQGSIPPTVPDWWRGSSDRRKAFATLMLLAGRRFAHRGPKFVETCWRTGIAVVQHLLEPPAGGGMPLTPGVTLNLYQELALLYIRYPDFDPAQWKLKQLIREIFAEKGQAIASHNLEAEQRFHTILGMIFAQQKNWGSDSDSHSAAFQLLWALKAADQRYQEEGIYQPLPEIKELQEHVYRASNQPEKANQSLWNAALAYMDIDQLNRAAQIIDEIPDAAGMDKVSLSKLLQLRSQASVGSANPDLVAQFQSLAGKAGVGAEFLKRQQFKILGDLVSTSSDLRDKSILQHALDAFDLTTKQGVPLVGVGDLMRWQAVQQRVVNSVGGQVKEVPIRGSGHVTATPLKLSLPGHTSPQTVEVPEATVQAAQIARAIGPENVVQMRSNLVYDGNKLSVPADKLDSAHIRERLKAVGIKVVAQ